MVQHYWLIMYYISLAKQCMYSYETGFQRLGSLASGKGVVKMNDENLEQMMMQAAVGCQDELRRLSMDGTTV